MKLIDTHAHLYDTRYQDNINEVIEEFAEDFDEDQIRLMRLKFLSEVGN